MNLSKYLWNVQVELWKIVCTLYSLEHSLAPLLTFRAQAFFRHKTSSETHRTVQVPVQMGHLTGLATRTQNTVKIPDGNLCSFSVWTTRGLGLYMLHHSYFSRNTSFKHKLFKRHRRHHQHHGNVDETWTWMYPMSPAQLQELSLSYRFTQSLCGITLRNIQKGHMSVSQAQRTTQFTFNVTANLVKAKPR